MYFCFYNVLSVGVLIRL